MLGDGVDEDLHCLSAGLCLPAAGDGLPDLLQALLQRRARPFEGQAELRHSLPRPGRERRRFAAAA